VQIESSLFYFMLPPPCILWVNFQRFSSESSEHFGKEDDPLPPSFFFTPTSSGSKPNEPGLPLGVSRGLSPPRRPDSWEYRRHFTRTPAYCRYLLLMTGFVCPVLGFTVGFPDTSPRFRLDPGHASRCFFDYRELHSPTGPFEIRLFALFHCLP